MPIQEIINFDKSQDISIIDFIVKQAIVQTELDTRLNCEEVHKLEILNILKDILPNFKLDLTSLEIHSNDVINTLSAMLDTSKTYNNLSSSLNIDKEKLKNICVESKEFLPGFVKELKGWKELYKTENKGLWTSCESNRLM